MTNRNQPRLLIVHAHPDDESIQTGGVIARYLGAGAQVKVVTCTLGEEGEVIGDTYAQLVADGGADQLGGYRIHELTNALAALSLGATSLQPYFLGGAGRWRDSGMAGTPAAEHPRAFVRSGRDSVSALAEVMVDFAPQVVIGYDPAGTYGHPDHIAVHRICGLAIEQARAAGTRIAKYYWSIDEESAVREGLARAASRVPVGWRMPEEGELPSYPDDDVTTAIDVTSVFDAKVAALQAHATQVTVAPSGREYALSNNILQPIGAVEYFILVDGTLAAGSNEREDDVFAGVDVTFT